MKIEAHTASCTENLILEPGHALRCTIATFTLYLRRSHPSELDTPSRAQRVCARCERARLRQPDAHRASTRCQSGSRRRCERARRLAHLVQCSGHFLGEMSALSWLADATWRAVRARELRRHSGVQQEGQGALRAHRAGRRRRNHACTVDQPRAARRTVTRRRAIDDSGLVRARSSPDGKRQLRPRPVTSSFASATALSWLAKRSIALGSGRLARRGTSLNAIGIGAHEAATDARLAISAQVPARTRKRLEREVAASRGPFPRSR